MTNNTKSNTSSSFGNFGNFSSSSWGSFGSQKVTEPVQDKAEPLPEELKNLTIKEALDDFEKKLEKQANEFQTQAKRIAKWDGMIYNSISLVEHLEQQIKTVESGQKDLKQNAESLLNEQEQFIKTLDSELHKQTINSVDSRQKIYILAHDLGEQYSDMNTRLAALIKEISGNSDPGSLSDIEKVDQILNSHLEAIKWLEYQSRVLEQKLNEIDEKMKQNHH